MDGLKKVSWGLDNRRKGAQVNKPPVAKVFATELGVLLLMAALVTWQKPQLALSFLLGGVIQCVPNWYFARQVFKFSGAAAARSVTQSFYRGEVGKFLLTGIGFALAFTMVDDLSAPALFAGFGLMTVSHVILTPLVKRY
jgi:ATP synthase protein I